MDSKECAEILQKLTFKSIAFNHTLDRFNLWDSQPEHI